MLLINLIPIIYTLKNFRAYVLKKPTTKSNIALLANNTIAFNLTKTEMNNLARFAKLNQYNCLLFSYTKIKYIDDQYQHLIKQYPFIKTLNTTHNKSFEQIFKLVKNNNSREHLSGIILTREKTKLKMRILGLCGCISVFDALNSFANLWNRKEIIDYKLFVKILFSWLYANILLNINFTLLNINLERKNVQKNKKVSKNIKKKQVIHKPLIIFSNENILI